MADTMLIEVMKISERLGATDMKARAAHDRLDTERAATLAALVEIKTSLKGIGEDVTAITAWMNTSKGAVKTMVIVSGLLGAVLGFAIKLLMK